MSRKEQGFTLIELMIVVAIIAIIAAIAVPNLLSSRVAANESNAISTLRNLVSAQAQFQTLGAIDADGDGTGEYGYFAELAAAPVAGALSVRNPAAPAGAVINPPVLGATFQTVAGGNVNKSGYFFRIYLPDAVGVGLSEAAAGGATGVAVDADSSEVFWSAYAWPVNAGTTGNRAFFVNQRGEILQTRMNVATFSTAAPVGLDWNSAYGAAAGDMGDALAISVAGGLGIDGNAWTPVQ